MVDHNAATLAQEFFPFDLDFPQRGFVAQNVPTLRFFQTVSRAQEVSGRWEGPVLKAE